MSRKKWSKAVKNRDNSVCQKCGLTADEAAIEAHHIVKRPGRSKVKDGVTLCKWCHLMADMGKSAFQKWLKSNGFFETLIDYIKNDDNKNKIGDFLEKVSQEEMKYFLGMVSKFEKDLKIKRSLVGKKVSEKIKVNNKCQSST